MAVRFWSLLVWSLVGAGAVFWALKLGAGAHALPAQAHLVQPQENLRGDLARLLGAGAVPAGAADDAAPVLDSRLTLVGVVSAPGGASTEDAVALISIDGEPPRPYRVGDQVDGKHVLQSVSQRKANLGPAGQPPQLSLTIPEPMEAQRGTPVLNGGGPATAGLVPSSRVPGVGPAPAQR